jgi:hypothetical protein
VARAGAMVGTNVGRSDRVGRNVRDGADVTGMLV